MSLNNAVKKKYRIQEMMEKLTVIEHAKLMKLIPKIIGKCTNTFGDYSNILLGDKKEIPYNIVVKLEILFGLPPNGLCNITITGSHYKKLI
jgi:hypothetical protein